jgi:hypothetical protein
VKRLSVPLYVLTLAALALTTLFATPVLAQTVTVSYVLIPTITPGVTVTKVELVRTDLTLKDVEATYVGDGQSGLALLPTHLKAYVGPSTSKPNPLLDLTPIVPSGGMVILDPVPGLDTVEVSFEVEQAPVRTAWKLPLLSADDFFPAGSTIYVLNLVKGADAASNLQLFNVGTTAATCKVQVLRPKGSLIEERDGISVPAVGVTGIPDILRRVGAATAAGITAAVTCDSPFYALGSYPATNRWDSRVEFPITESPTAKAKSAVILDHRPGTFFRVVQGNSDLHIPLTLDPAVAYHTLSIDFDAAVKDPNSFVVFRNVIGMFRFGGRRFGKTLYFGSFENFGKQKFVVDVGTPFIETTLKRNFPLRGGHTYHFSITLDNDQQSLHYVITNESGGVVMDLLGGLYNSFNVVNGNGPIIEMGLGGVADNAYFPPYGWAFRNLEIVATK